VARGSFYANQSHYVAICAICVIFTQVHIVNTKHCWSRIGEGNLALLVNEVQIVFS
jgi:hypothetical protein